MKKPTSYYIGIGICVYGFVLVGFGVFKAITF